MSKTLYLHIGIHKTGSSALQSFFAQNRELLDKKGITYFKAHDDAKAKKGKITSGNGATLGLYLKQQLSKQDAKKFISEFNSQLLNCNQHALISSESLNFLNQTETLNIIRLAKKHQFSIKCIAYIRSPVGYSISAYSQQIKQSLSTKYFFESLKNSQFPNKIQSIKNILPILGSHNIILRNYDLVKSNLAEDFITYVLNLDNNDFIIQNKKINRSLTQAELEICRQLNQFFDKPSQGIYISNHLVYSNPELSSEKFISQTDLDFCKNKFQSEVDYLNETDSNLKLQLISPDVKIISEYPKSDISSIDSALLELLASFIIKEQGPKKVEKSFYSKLRNSIKKS